MSEKIRSFIAIEIPENIRKDINRYIQELQKHAPKLKWVKPESLHITLKFLGEQDPQRIEQAIVNLTKLGNNLDGFDLSIKNFGAFPNEKRPKVLWLGLEAIPRESFFGLFNRIEDTLEGIGFEREQRKFSPHLTLARIKYPDNFSGLFEFVAKNPFETHTFSVDGFVLMRSFLKQSGAEYKVIQKYPLHG